MGNNDAHSLEAELRQAGASSGEARELAEFARSLHQLKGREPRLSSVKRPQSRPFAALVASVAVVGAIGLAIASIAQNTYPGNLLYPVKRLTENVAVIVEPNYRGVLMMRRAQEVKQLVALHDNPQLINATLKSYKNEAADYRGGNYADFEYCESTLRQAETMSSDAERVAIAETIASVKNEAD